MPISYEEGSQRILATDMPSSEMRFPQRRTASSWSLRLWSDCVTITRTADPPHSKQIETERRNPVDPRESAKSQQDFSAWIHEENQGVLERRNRHSFCPSPIARFRNKPGEKSLAFMSASWFIFFLRRVPKASCFLQSAEQLQRLPFEQLISQPKAPCVAGRKHWQSSWVQQKAPKERT